MSLSTVGGTLSTVGGSLAGLLPVSDAFNRADNTSSLGTTDTGQTWLLDGSGPWGVISGQGYRSGGSDGEKVTVPCGVSDMAVSASMLNRDAFHQGLVARVSDDRASFYLLDGPGTAAWRLGKVVSGVFTQLASGTAAATYTTMKLSVSGSTVTASVDGVVVATVTDTSLTAGTRAGFRYGGSGTTVRFDDFTVTAP